MFNPNLFSSTIPPGVLYYYTITLLLYVSVIKQFIYLLTRKMNYEEIHEKRQNRKKDQFIQRAQDQIGVYPSIFFYLIFVISP